MADISDRTLVIVIAVTSFGSFIGMAYGLLTRTVPVIPVGPDYVWLGLGLLILLIVAGVWMATRQIEPWGVQKQGEPKTGNQ